MELTSDKWNDPVMQARSQWGTRAVPHWRWSAPLLKIRKKKKEKKEKKKKKSRKKEERKMEFLLPNPKSFFELDDAINSGLGALYREEDVRYGCDHICSTIYI